MLIFPQNYEFIAKIYVGLTAVLARSLKRLLLIVTKQITASPTQLKKHNNKAKTIEEVEAITNQILNQ